jgi:hypothetical protein
MNSQLGTDLAQGPALGVQIGSTLNVHRDTVTAGTSRRSAELKRKRPAPAERTSSQQPPLALSNCYVDQ